LLSFGAVDFIPKYGVEFYPFGWLFVLVYMAIVAYAITRYA